MEFQQTIAAPIEISGVGLHSAQHVHLTILPAPENYGIVFERVDLRCNNLIPARFDNVVSTSLCTTIGNSHGVMVGTIEHLMSALWGHKIDNVHIQINNCEVPIMDGSSSAFVKLIEEAGIIPQKACRKIIKIVNEVEFNVDGQCIKISPSDSFGIDLTINYSDPAIGQQSLSFYEEDNFDKDISNARTFGFVKDLEALQDKGLALGASMENAIAISDHGVMNKEGLRYADEFVRHKILDCIGDLYLAGARIQGYVQAFKTGHAVHNKFLRKLFAQQEAYIYLTS